MRKNEFATVYNKQIMRPIVKKILEITRCSTKEVFQFCIADV